ncbi:MAG: hypothetical protein E7214_06245 [Clostridium sp.]|nr:hypothetical protein [Clostridium sp.]
MHAEEWAEKYSNIKTIKNWFDDKLNNKSTSLEKYIINDLNINREYTANNPLSLISSHLGLYDINLEMACKLKGRDKRDVCKNKVECLFMLEKGLEKLKDKYDFVFVDCQPSFDLLTQNAIVASDYYIIPTKLDYFKY